MARTNTNITDEKLISIKKNIKESHDYFKDNVIRFNKFKNFVCNTALNSDDIAKLGELQKPTIEFNVIEAFVNRLLGEFYKTSPSLAVRAAESLPLDLMTPQFLAQMDAVEGIIRHIISGGTRSGLKASLYADQLYGGYAAAQVKTDYVNSRSFEQNIFVERVFDPTLCGWDPLARLPHKGDGKFCFELFPMTQEDFIQQFGKDAAKGIKFSRSLDDFSWSYSEGKKKICLVAHYFEKVEKKETLIKLTDGKNILKRHLPMLKKMWEMKNYVEQFPQIVEERPTTVEHITRYTVCENERLDKVETNFSHLPIVFFDGNSQIIRKEQKEPSKQMTKPYAYHVMGMQKFMNMCGQTLAADIEGFVQHKFKVALESIPEKYVDAYVNPQQESILIYRAFDEDDPTKALPPPMEITKVPPPQVVENMFLNGPNMIQHILGSYQAELGNNNSDTSGVAIENGTLSGNPASAPYSHGFNIGLNRIGEICLDLLPKYYVTPRTIPIIRPNGQHEFIEINKLKPEGDASLAEERAGSQVQNPQAPVDPVQQEEEKKYDISLIFDPTTMQISVTAGVNSAIEKRIALDQLLKLMEISPTVAEYINSEGIDTVLSNIEIRNIEDLRVKMNEFLKQKKAQPPQPDPAMELVRGEIETENRRIDQKAEESQQKNELEIQKVAIEAEKDLQKAQIEQQKLLLDAATEAQKGALEKEKLNLEFIKLSNELDLADRKQLLDEHKVATDASLDAMDLISEAAEAVSKVTSDDSPS